MPLQWSAPKHSMHGDLVELIAPFGPYTMEFGMVPTGDRPPQYYVACCPHEGRGGPIWTETFHAADEAKSLAQQWADRMAGTIERYTAHAVETMTIAEFIQQLGDVELTFLEDMITKEYRRRAENMVNGVGEAVRDPLRLHTARVTQ